jgi:apoptosis-stimulating of p53 protein 1
MAMRQQHQIESQQQMLVAKEQRLKYLRQQDFRHNQMSAEYERLRRLREKVIKIVITYFWLYSSLKP